MVDGEMVYDDRDIQAKVFAERRRVSDRVMRIAAAAPIL
jgi:hypothetical protein